MPKAQNGPGSTVELTETYILLQDGGSSGLHATPLEIVGLLTAFWKEFDHEERTTMWAMHRSAVEQFIKE